MTLTAPTTPRDPAAERSSSSFRPDIQALRALAVFAVVLYHLWPERLPGGFVGVDVFFVISGYLITRHLTDELDRTGRVRLLRFWGRRIRRLLPAAFTVLVASLGMLLLLMPRVTWRQNLQEIGAASAYVENWLLGLHAIDYLAAENSASLVQHYWSLSAEEQFYLVWPFLLLLGAGLGLAFKLPARRAVFGVLAAVTLLSLAFSVVFTARQPELAFFATPTRAWEFGLGGLLASGPALRPGRRDEAVRAGAAWAGLVLVGLSLFLVTGSRPFPGWIALVPALGAVLLLAGGGSAAAWGPGRLADRPVVQWLGDHSYSIYLWHWPLIVLTPWLLHGPTPWPGDVAILGASLVLAGLTKRFVEDPVRTGARWRAREWPAYLFAATGAALLVLVSTTGMHRVDHETAAQVTAARAAVVDGTPCFGAAAMVEAGCARPFARPAGLDTAFAAADYDLRGDVCQQNRPVVKVEFCEYGELRSPTRTVVLVGNSHAVRLAPMLDLYGREHGWKILLAAKTDCLGLLKDQPDEPAGDPCTLWSADLLRRLEDDPRIDEVVFASHRDAVDYLAGEDASPEAVARAQQAVLTTWRTLKQHGVPVTVTEDVPALWPDRGPECVARSAAEEDPCPRPRSEVVRPNLVSGLAQQHPELVSYLPMSRYFCDAERCHALIGGVVVYTDAHHITTTFSLSLARYLGPQIGRNLRPASS